MIALTQGQREKLIAHNSEKLKGLKDAVKQTAFESVREGLEFEIQSTEITLASLTAVPFGWEIAGSIFPTLEEALKPGYIGTPEPIYDEPPVPGIKLPELKGDGDIYNGDIGDSSFYVGEESGWNKRIAEIKRLNGLGE